MGHEVKKIESKIMTILSDALLYEVHDKISKITTISEVIVTNDKLIAKVYVSFFEGNPEENLKKLNKTKGFLRTQLAKNLDKRKAPEIEFYVYDKLEKMNQIEEILEKLK